MKISALIPCRKGSQRIKDKNTRKFANSSLFEIKVDQLLLTKDVDEIIISTNDEKIIEIAKKYLSKTTKKITIHERDEYFSSNECSNQEMIEYFVKNLDYENLLWTHVTSPFITEKTYKRAINEYKEGIKNNKFDSLVSVECYRNFVWDKNKRPINYSDQIYGLWPKTQLVDPIYICNSGIFIVSKNIALKNNDRIGKKPIYFENNLIESIDIDWPKDIKVAEKIWKTFYNK